MRAVWLEDRHLSWRGNIPEPITQPGEALLRIRLAGICGTDLELVSGYYPYQGILGHEFVGEVVACPAAPEWLGQRVVAEINVTCGECRACRQNRPSHCERRSVVGIKGHAGIFAEYIALPLRNLLPVPVSVTDEQAVFTEPLAAALEIFQQVHIQPTDRVLLVGAGRLGQLIAQTLALRGHDFQVVVRNQLARDLLAQQGIPTLSAGEIQPAAYDLVIEATGVQAGFQLARQAARPRGTLVLKSTFAGNLDLNISSLVVDEITLVGSRCGPFAPALHLLEHSLVDPLPLIQARYPLSQALQAFAHAAQPGVFKVLLDPAA